jgi:HEAT repeat protein
LFTFAAGIDGTDSFGCRHLKGNWMKIYMNQFNEYLGQLANNDIVVRQKAVCGLAKYSTAEWQGTPDAVSSAVPALVKASRPGGALPADATVRAEAVKALGNIGADSSAVMPELVRILQEDSELKVRTEAVRALGKIGEKAGTASRALAAVVVDPDCEDVLRGEAARALARVAPLAPGTAAVLREGAHDRNGFVSVRAAEALWKVSGDASRAAEALVARLEDPAVRDAAAQALNRIGPGAKGAVQALLAAMKSNDRLFRESVIMALRKIDPAAAAKAGV